MNPVQLFVIVILSVFSTWFFLSIFYDTRNERKQRRIAELERENADLHFEADRADAVKRDFNEECG